MTSDESDPDIIGEDPRLANSSAALAAAPARLDHRQVRRHGSLGLLIVMAIGVVVAFMNIIRISNRKPDGS